jgi:ketosteroid isomerase-like protein
VDGARRGAAAGGTFTGPDSVANDVFATVPQNVDEFTCTVDRASEQGDTVAATVHFKGKNKTGAELDTQAEHVWEVRDGKVTRFENNVDREVWAEAWS